MLCRVNAFTKLQTLAERDALDNVSLSIFFIRLRVYAQTCFGNQSCSDVYIHTSHSPRRLVPSQQVNAERTGLRCGCS